MMGASSLSSEVSKLASNCVGMSTRQAAYAALGCHGVPCLNMAFRIDQQLAHAGGERYLLQLAGGEQALIEGSNGWVEAGRGEHGHVERGRTPARPPRTVRLPRSEPLSRLKGATPTSAAICLGPTVPAPGPIFTSGTV